ncbi:hypothetical protein V866_000988 [Kwoniella sp. B9012]|uniref:Uncharacterized protein n=1 Tax=Kwoniella europaea PYCC6329 TaxID=1423913 RepID=A0AAX4KAF6_9TREE
MPPSTPPSRSSRLRPTPYNVPTSASTTEFIPSSPSTVFRLVGDHAASSSCLADSNQIAALQRAYEVAKQFVWSPLGLGITNTAMMVNEPPREKDAPASGIFDWTVATMNGDVMKRQKEFDADSVLEIVVDTKTKSYGYVSSVEPTIIHVRNDIVVAAGHAYALKHQQPYVLANHLLFLAVTLAHEMQHVLRMVSLGLLYNTPPSVWDKLHSRPAVLVENKSTKDVIWGEGGYFFERCFLGGKLDAYLVEERNSPLFPNQIDYLGVSFVRDNKLWSLALHPRSVLHLVNLNDAWSQLLPFVRGDSKVIEGYLSAPRLRENVEQTQSDRIVHRSYLIHVSPSPSPKKQKKSESHSESEDLIEQIQELQRQHKQFAFDNSPLTVKLDIPSDDWCGTKRMSV